MSTYFDLDHHLRYDPKFSRNLQLVTGDIAKLEQQAKTNPAARRQISDKLLDIYRSCKFNPSLLLPHLFPAYPRETPFSLQDRSFAIAMMAFTIGGFTAIRAARQIGKALPEDEPVLTPQGWRPIGELRVGDMVFAGDGRPTRVTGVHPQGVKDIFRVEFSDGSWTRCCEDHLWTCRTNTRNKSWTVRSLREIRSLKGGDHPNSDRGVRIPLTGPAQFPRRDYHIHPYVLGVLIGDGSLTPGNLKLTSDDPELVARVSELQPDIRLCPIGKQGFNIRQGCPAGPGKKGKFRQELERLDLRKRAELKTIPEEYLFGSVEDRTELLRGLMDTDGSIFGKCQMEFYTSSHTLAEQVQFLVESLGGKANLKTKDAYYRAAMGERRQGLPCYRVKVWLQDICPFWLPRKAEKFYPIKYEKTRILAHITPEPRQAAVCITVASTESTFLTRNCIVTHNSTTLGARQLSNAELLPKWSSAYIVPHSEHKRTYASRLEEMEQALRYFRKRHDFRSNLNFKRRPNGSRIELLNILTSAAPARGKSFDELCYDEYQLFDTHFEPEVEQCQSATDIPVRIYAGTSTTLDSPLEARFQSSSQGTWFIRTYRQGKWIDCGDPDQIIPIMRAQGPTCPYTGQILDPTNGVWVHKDRSYLELNQVGLHIPKFIVPKFGKTMKGWLEIYKYFKDYPRDMFLNEVVGIPTASGSREISEADLKRICVLPDTEEGRLKKCREGYYRIIVSGCDWGGSEFDPVKRIKTSYSTHVMLGLNPYGKWEVIHMMRYPGMDYRMVVRGIIHDHVKFGGMALGSDYGAGMAYNSWLRSTGDIIPDRHMVLWYGGAPRSPILKPFDTPDAFNYYVLNKTESLTELFAAIKAPEPEILCYNWGEARQYLIEFLNTYRVPSESELGGRRFRVIRDPAKADDIVHAMNFALVVGRIMQGRPIFEDPAANERLRALLGGAYSQQLSADDLDLSPIRFDMY